MFSSRVVNASRAQAKSAQRRAAVTRRRLIIAAGVVTGIAITSYVTRKQIIPRHQLVLALDLSKPPPEVPTPSIFNFRPQLSMFDTIRAIDYAASDPKVSGILANVGDFNQYSLAQAQEIRAAIQRFKLSGKSTHCYAPSFGELGPGNISYYLATIFDEIHLQPCGDLILSGYDLNQPFFRSMLAWLGVKPDFIKRKEYKNAPNQFLEDSFTQPHRESMTSILTSMYNTVIDSIAATRQLSRDRVIELINSSPMTSQQAKESKLVDSLQYENQIIANVKRPEYLKSPTTNSAVLNRAVAAKFNSEHDVKILEETNKAAYEKAMKNESLTEADRERINQLYVEANKGIQKMKEKIGEGKLLEDKLILISSQGSKPATSTPTVSPAAGDKVDSQILSLGSNVKLERFSRYANQVIEKLNAKDKAMRLSGSPQIALLYGVGTVTNEYKPYDGRNQFSAPIIAKTLHKLSHDPLIKAIVFRVDSPGGSSQASDTIHTALMEAKAHGKKIIVSMGSMAASGGYYVAAPADYIFANHSTLTGSIGVFGGKFVIRDLLEKRLHVSLDRIKVGDDVAAGMNSLVQPWSEQQRERMELMIDRIYSEFVSKVATGRKMSLIHAESLAHGRVWMGHEAKSNGLVDEIGGLTEAINKAKQLISAPNAVVTITPKPKNLISILKQQLGGQDAEWDDEPVFSQGPQSSQSKLKLLSTYLLTEFISECCQLIGINIKKEISSHLSLDSEGGNEISLNVQHSEIGALMDSEGKLKI